MTGTRDAEQAGHMLPWTEAAPEGGQTQQTTVVRLSQHREKHHPWPSADKEGKPSEFWHQTVPCHPRKTLRQPLPGHADPLSCLDGSAGAARGWYCPAAPDRQTFCCPQPAPARPLPTSPSKPPFFVAPVKVAENLEESH